MRTLSLDWLLRRRPQARKLPRPQTARAGQVLGYHGLVRTQRSQTPGDGTVESSTTGEAPAANTEVRIVIDHVDGTRRGQRQELPADARIRFGRHPECEVAFDAHRDIDASSRHAELRPVGSSWVLVDLGSSNGTFVEGHRSTEAPIAAGVPTMVEFGPGGPRLRLFIGDDAALAALPPPPRPRRVPRWQRAALGGGAGLVALGLLWLLVRGC